MRCYVTCTKPVEYRREWLLCAVIILFKESCGVARLLHRYCGEASPRGLVSWSPRVARILVRNWRKEARSPVHGERSFLSGPLAIEEGGKRSERLGAGWRQSISALAISVSVGCTARLRRSREHLVARVC